MSYMSPSVCDEKGMCLYRLPDVEPILEIKNDFLGKKSLCHVE